MLRDNMYGIDLGTSTIKIYDAKKDTFSKEKNMVAVRNGDTLFAVGNEAYEMFEKTPANIQVTTPMSNGRIGDVMLVEAVLHTLLNRSGTSMGHRPILFFSVPVDMTELEKRAYYSIAHRGRLRKCQVFLVEKPVADALALGISLKKTKGSLVVNIGAQSTEISALAAGRVVISKTIPIGGKHFNRAVEAAVRRKNNFRISLKTAKRLKIALTDLPGKKLEGRRVMGMDTAAGLPRDGNVSCYTVTAAVAELLEQISLEIQKFLERIPPQIRENIRREGIFFTGGSTQFPGLDRFFSERLNCPVHLSQHYDLCTICGLRELIRHPVLHHLAFVPKRRREER